MNFFRLSLKYCLVSSCIFYLSCSTEVELESADEVFPVVYGIINPTDTAHYLRIERVFKTQGGDAEQLAQDFENLYYPLEDIAVKLEKDNGLEAVLVRVDGNNEGFVRQDGPFANTPNYLYKVKANDFRTSAGERVTLTISLEEGSQTVSAQTLIVGDLAVSNTSPASSVNMGYERTIRTSWTSDEAAAIFDLSWLINYRERAVGGEWTTKQLRWTIANRIENLDGVVQQTETFRGEEFYQFLATQIETRADVEREFVDIEVEVIALGSEFEEIALLNAANVGITSSQVDLTFSNIDGGIGVFSSRTSANREGINLSTISLDSLRDGIYTSDLNF
ncbi:MAG: DUF4249 family protein [Bacteroidota bacterium]